MRIVRRQKVLVGVLTFAGLLVAAAYTVVVPPVFTSQALIVANLPQSATEAPVTASGVTQAMETQVVIATSQPVLEAALPKIRSGISFTQLNNDVMATAITDSVLDVTAKAKSATQAESMANAVAASYVAYVGTTSSPVGYVKAQVFEPATQVTGRGLPVTLAFYGLLGLVGGAFIGCIAALVRGRSDRRLRRRDEIANSIGVPVIADIPVLHPSDPAGWVKLLNDYEPGPVQSWRLRKMIEQLGITDMAAGNGRGRGSSLTVLTLSTDSGALGLGPQIATFAAALGIPTMLVINAHGDPATTAQLRTACESAMGTRMSKPLRVAVSRDGRFPDPRVAFVVVVVVLDGKELKMPDTMVTSATLIGVSAGATTAEQLARVATSAATNGHDIAGILVADPDPEDQTTGRIPRLSRPVAAQNMYPNRLMGVMTETKQ